MLRIAHRVHKRNSSSKNDPCNYEKLSTM
jgi:hypothetical protein